MVAGLGSIGRRHLRNLVALGEKDILLYRTHHSTLPDEELAGFPVETDLGAALVRRPDAVIVANPTAAHLDVAIPAARAGCHLLMEKPVAGELGVQVRELESVVASRGVKTLVGFQFRFHPVLNQIRQAVQSGRLGHPLSFRAHWGEYLPGWHPWEDYRQSYAARKNLGGGVVNTLCHPLDYVRWLFGEVETVSAVTGHVSQLDMDVEDVAEITLGFQGGVVGSVHLDYFQRPASHWLAVNLEGGQIQWDDATGAARLVDVVGEKEEVLAPPGDFERNHLFLEESRHFLAVIRGEADSRCDLTDGIKALELTEAVHESARSGRQVWLPSHP